MKVKQLIANLRDIVTVDPTATEAEVYFRNLGLLAELSEVNTANFAVYKSGWFPPICILNAKKSDSPYILLEKGSDIPPGVISNFGQHVVESVFAENWNLMYRLKNLDGACLTEETKLEFTNVFNELDEKIEAKIKERFGGKISREQMAQVELEAKHHLREARAVFMKTPLAEKERYKAPAVKSVFDPKTNP